MRTQGVPGHYATGDASSGWEKFEQWARTGPFTARNPLFYWMHLELRRYFGIEILLNACTAAIRGVRRVGCSSRRVPRVWASG